MTDHQNRLELRDEKRSRQTMWLTFGAIFLTFSGVLTIIGVLAGWSESPIALIVWPVIAITFMWTIRNMIIRNAGRSQ
ncbi:hypothetical protein IEU95_01810 [Hoyosella rhizosphaerae]|uniref:Uncharacterized protein n=1 Tax=Hoyosella rhizosphaerae TaxID=1755582 RepID=A0A916UDM7_9ACTN|nr:hypothetical protein [Hoyosella rhizosphaerae]MBN4925551.1 hypothetical protein [Hoyosella rhizosphaerae]GGC69782.1 hypothetical protein GCM10011410_23250 [Hoyosella rhizosphaerae]